MKPTDEELIDVLQNECRRLRRELEAALEACRAYKESMAEQREYWVGRVRALGAKDV